MNDENVIVVSLQLQDALFSTPIEHVGIQEESASSISKANALAAYTNRSDNDTMPCRICLSTDTSSEMISPCLCKGSIANIHVMCLERWLSQKGNNRCDLCSFEFNVYSTLKYTMMQSLAIWIKHPTNRGFFIYDSAVFLILNMLTLVVISLFVRNLNAIVSMNITDTGITVWFIASGMAAILFWIIVYCLAVSLYVNAQVRPWYQWWKSSRTIRLVINA